MTSDSGEHSFALPTDALSDAIARIGDDGVLYPHNTRMRDLLAEHGREMGVQTTRIEQLPWGDVEAMREAEILGCGQTTYSCRVVVHAGARWLIATEMRGVSAGLAAELASKRLRALGGFAGSIVHDLANLLLAGVGVAETLQPYVKDKAEAQALDELKVGARQGTALGRALASLLNRSPRNWQTVSLNQIMDDVVSIVRKNAVRRGVTFAVTNDLDCRVRVLFDEAVQALMHALLYCVEGGAQSLSLATQLKNVTIAVGRDRQVASLRITASPVADRAIDLAREVLTGDQGLLDALNRAPLDASGLAHARLAMVRVGGEVRVSSSAESLVLDYIWPTIRTEKSASRRP